MNILKRVSCIIFSAVNIMLILAAFSIVGCSDETTSPNEGDVPDVPGGVVVEGGDESCTVSWNGVSGATSYNVYYSTSSDVNPENGNKEEDVTSPHTITGLTNGTTYYIVVTAVNSYGESLSSAPHKGGANKG